MGGVPTKAIAAAVSLRTTGKTCPHCSGCCLDQLSGALSPAIKSSPSNDNTIGSAKVANLSIIKSLLSMSNHPYVNLSYNATCPSMSDYCPVLTFFIACHYGLTEIAHSLIKQEKSIDVARLRDIQGFSPLYIACYKGHFELVKMLLACTSTSDLVNTGNDFYHNCNFKSSLDLQVNTDYLLHRGDDWPRNLFTTVCFS